MTREELGAIVRGVVPVLREIVTTAVASVTTRVDTLERGAPAADLSALRERLARLETSAATAADAARDLGGLRERVAVVEARAPQPGPPGPPGFDLEDFSASYDGDRTVTLSFTRGGLVKHYPLTLPLPKYEGTYRAGAPYAAGALVTWEGSLWLCREATSAKPLDGAKHWTLIVKRGRDGKDGKDGKDGETWSGRAS